jgi:hypothetical protein
VSAPVVKNRHEKCPETVPNSLFLARWCLVATALADDHNTGIPGELTGFVLNVPLSSAICR